MEKKMKKGKLETEVRLEEIESLSLGNLSKMISDVEFLSETEVENFDSFEESYRFINVSGGPNLDSLKYSVDIYGYILTNQPVFGDKELIVLDSKKYTHAQVRDMRSVAKRKGS